jgi:hypothetical protein
MVPTRSSNICKWRAPLHQVVHTMSHDVSHDFVVMEAFCAPWWAFNIAFLY